MIVYCVSPIDSWFGWLSETEYRKQLVKSHGDDLQEAAHAWEAYLGKRSMAFELTKKVGWEGDIVGNGKPMIAALPADTESELVIGWRQISNGTTFVASPFELPWLSTITFEKIEG